jgi:hypothetical protein
MRLHLDALTLLHRIWGGFGVLAGTSLAILAVGTEAALVDSGSLGRAERAAVWVLATCATVQMAVGFASLLVARGLRRRRSAGRAWALALAVPNLILVPFGTVLGAYTLWVLLNNDARREFGRPPRGSSPAAATAG